MEYRIDHDYHIHTNLSLCTYDPLQTPANIVAYAAEHGIKKICITDHMWDEAALGPHINYGPQNWEHVIRNLPLPESDKVKVCFGVETDIDKYFRLGIARDKIDKLDFLVVPTTHMHFEGVNLEAGVSYDVRAQLWADRLAALLQMDLPWHKVGIAHLTSPLLAGSNPEDRKHYIDILRKVNPDTMRRLFGMIAKKGAGFELNFNPATAHTDEDRAFLMSVYRMAKEEGNKFYIGSDAHVMSAFSVYDIRRKTVAELGLTEEDKFDFE